MPDSNPPGPDAPGRARTRRRVLGGLATLGSACAAAGAGTYAFMTDTAASGSNDVSAALIDLTLDGGSNQVTFLDQTDIVPGDSGQSSVVLGNEGSVAADVQVTVAAIRSLENDIIGSESNQDSTPNDGELDEHLEIRGTIDGTTVFARQTVASLTVGQTFQPGVSIGGGGNRTFTLEWWLPSDTTVEAQSDGVEIDFDFELLQQGVP